jgi:hypothetical protein
VIEVTAMVVVVVVDGNGVAEPGFAEAELLESWELGGSLCSMPHGTSTREKKWTSEMCI